VSSDGNLRIGSWAIGSGALLGATLLAGRLSGLLREIELAAAFGVSAEADAAVLLLTLPDLLVNLLLSGGLSAALVPRLQALPLHSAQVLLRQTLLFVFLLFSLQCLAFGLRCWHLDSKLKPCHPPLP
jgi:putative peptidoglycan lipid II flippase